MSVRLSIDLGHSNIKVCEYNPKIRNKNDLIHTYSLDFGKEFFPNILTVSCSDRSDGTNDAVFSIIPDQKAAGSTLNIPDLNTENIGNIKEMLCNEASDITVGNNRFLYSDLVYHELEIIIRRYCEEKGIVSREDIEAVLTVPPDFSEYQRRIYREAAESAGIRTAVIVEEPFAGFLAHQDYINSLEENRDYNILAVDCGGGTTDLAIINVNTGGGKKTIQNLCSKSIRFGGNTIDRMIIAELKTRESVLNDIKKAHDIYLATVIRRLPPEDQESSSPHLKANSKKIQAQIIDLLLKESRQLKEELCSLAEQNDTEARERAISFLCAIANTPVMLKLSKQDLTDMIRTRFCEPFRCTMNEMLDICNINKDMIDGVVMFGGCSELSDIRTIICEYFGNDLIASDHELRYTAVSKGALIYLDKKEDITINNRPGRYTVGTEDEKRCFIPLLRPMNYIAGLPGSGPAVMPQAVSGRNIIRLYRRMYDDQAQPVIGKNTIYMGYYDIGDTSPAKNFRIDPANGFRAVYWDRTKDKTAQLIPEDVN